MKNTERQRSLDREKWYKSLANDSDQSGKMEYCQFCNKRGLFDSCEADQRIRESACLCATAYNRMKRKGE